MHFYLLSSLILVGFLPFALLKYSEQGHRSLRTRKVEKVAVLSVYIAEALPVWFDLFARTVGNNQKYVDWFIFTLDKAMLLPRQPLPNNIHIFPLASSDLAHRISMVDGSYKAAYTNHNEAYMQKVREITQYVIQEFPYALVEFKPAFAEVFLEFIEHYSHYAYADMDIVLGDWSILPWKQVFEEYEIVTFTFGDHHSLYLRGQMTVFQNTQRIRQLYSKCSHLANFSIRGEKFRSESSSDNKWPLQSAEGCISRTAFEEGLTILYLPWQRSDAYRGGKGEAAILMNGESVHDNMKLVYCQYHQVNATLPVNSNVLAIPPRDAIRRLGHAVQVQIGVESADTRCSYWIDPQYDVCALSHIPANAIIATTSSQQVYYVNAPHLAASSKVIYRLQGQLASPTDSTDTKMICYESLLFHMQVLKRRLTSSTSGRLAVAKANAVAITSSGLIPYMMSNDSSVALAGETHYCLRFDSLLLHCQCLLPASSIHIHLITDQRKLHDKPALSQLSAKIAISSSATDIPAVTFSDATSSWTVSVADPHCASSYYERVPLLFNIYLDRRKTSHRNDLDTWSMELSHSDKSSTILAFKPTTHSVDGLLGAVDSAYDEVLVVVIESAAVLPNHLLRVPEELFDFSLQSHCPLIQLYLPRLKSNKAVGGDDLLLLLLHFHLLGQNLSIHQATRQRRQPRPLYNASTVAHTLDICLSAAPDPYDKLIRTWQAYVKKSGEIASRGLSSIVVRADRDELVSMSSVGKRHHK